MRDFPPSYTCCPVSLRLNPTVVSKHTEVVSVRELADQEVLRDMLIGVVAGGLASRASELGNVELFVLSALMLVTTLIVLWVLRRVSEWSKPAENEEDRPYEDVKYAS